MNVGERVKSRRKQLKLSADKLGKMIGKDRATVYRYESNAIENMPYDVVVPLAEALKVSPAYLMGWEQSNPLQLITDYIFYPTPVSAGLPFMIDSIMEEDLEKIAIPDSIMGKWAGHDNVFVLKVNGESMNNVIPHESLIAVKKVEISQLNEGDIVVFSDENEYSMKRFYNDKQNERFIFRPDSKNKTFLDHSVKYSEAKDLVIHGKVVVYIVELD